MALCFHMDNAIAATEPLVCTIGHSNRPLATFLDLLRSNEIAHLLDVRTVPRSSVQSRRIARLVRRGSNCLYPSSGTRRLAPRAGRFSQRWLAQSVVSRLCGLHAILCVRRQRSMGRGLGTHGAMCVDVRGSGALALSSLNDRRRASCARYSCRGHYRTEGPQATCSYRVRSR
jgi:hypothetical protein